MQHSTSPAPSIPSSHAESPVHPFSLPVGTRAVGRPLPIFLPALTLLMAALLALMASTPTSAQTGSEPAHRLDPTEGMRAVTALQATPEPVQANVPAVGWELDLSLDVSEGSVYDVEWSPDGRSIAALTYEIAIWDVAAAEVTTTLDLVVEGDILASAYHLAWSPDGKHLAAATNFGVLIWETETWEAAFGPLGDNVLSADWSPDGSLLAAGGLYGGVAIYAVPEGEKPMTPEGDLLGSVFSLAWSPDGKRLAAAVEDSVVVWDTATWKQVTTFRHPQDTVFSVSWSPDSSMVAQSFSNGVVRIGDVAKGEIVQTAQHGTGTIYSVDWSPRGDQIAAGTENGEVVVWDAQSWESTVITATPGLVYSVDWSPDGARLALGNDTGQLQVWRQPSSTGEPTSPPGPAPQADARCADIPASDSPSATVVRFVNLEPGEVGVHVYPHGASGNGDAVFTLRPGETRDETVDLDAAPYYVAVRLDLLWALLEMGPMSKLLDYDIRHDITGRTLQCILIGGLSSATTPEPAASPALTAPPHPSRTRRQRRPALLDPSRASGPRSSA